MSTHAHLIQQQEWTEAASIMPMDGTVASGWAGAMASLVSIKPVTSIMRPLSSHMRGSAPSPLCRMPHRRARECMQFMPCVTELITCLREPSGPTARAWCSLSVPISPSSWWWRRTGPHFCPTALHKAYSESGSSFPGRIVYLWSP